MSKPRKRCSSLDRELSCPGSATVFPLVDPRPDAEVTTEGTAVHSHVAARCCAELGATIEACATIEAIPATTWYVHPSSQWIADFCFREVQENVPNNWALEVEVYIEEEFQRYILSGHLDCLAVSPDGTEALIFDFKAGYIPVDPAEQNDQLAGYSVLLIGAYPDLKKITAKIVQPRNNPDDGFERVSTVVIEGARLQAVRASLESRINAALDNPMHLKTGDKQCKYCIGCQCPAIIATRQLMEIELTPESLAEIRRTPSDSTLADWLISARILGNVIDEVKGIAKDRIAVTGFLDTSDGLRVTTKTTKGSYDVPDPVAFYRKARSLIPSEELFAKTLSFSMSATKDAIAEVTGLPKTSKKGESAESKFDAELRPLTVQGTRTTFVVA